MLIWCSAYPVKSSRTIAISIDKGITVTTIEAGRHPRKTKTTKPMDIPEKLSSIIGVENYNKIREDYTCLR